MKTMKSKINKSVSESQLSLNVPCILKNTYPYSKSLGYKIGSPSPRSICDSDLEPYLNAYPILPSNGSNYPQNDLQEPDWLDIPQAQPQPQRFNVGPPYNPPYLFNYSGSNPVPQPSQMSYTHGIENRIINNYPQAYNTTVEANLEPFPDFLSLQNEDLDWLVDDMVSASATSQAQPKKVLVTFDVKAEPTALDAFISSNMSGHKSDTSEALTSYEESESQTSSEDGCTDEFDADPTMESVYEGGTDLSNKNLLFKSSLALNSMYSSYPMTMNEVITSIDNGSSWLQSGDDEDLVSGIVEAFLS
jgi:hypothetical protein